MNQNEDLTSYQPLETDAVYTIRIDVIKPVNRGIETFVLEPGDVILYDILSCEMHAYSKETRARRDFYYFSGLENYRTTESALRTASQWFGVTTLKSMTVPVLCSIVVKKGEPWSC